MGLKAKDIKQRLSELRDENKDNPNYPKLKLIGNKLEVTINNQKTVGTKEEMYEKFKTLPYFIEEYDDITKNDFISYNMGLIDKQLKSKYE